MEQSSLMDEISGTWPHTHIQTHTNTFREIQLGERLSNRRHIEVTTAGVTKQTHTGLICVCVAIM